MDVRVQPFLDAGEQDAEGLWDYYYEGDNYLFSVGQVELRGRVYTDEPARAYFLATARECRESGLLSSAVEYLRRVGVQEFYALGPSGGCESVSVDGGGDVSASARCPRMRARRPAVPGRVRRVG